MEDKDGKKSRLLKGNFLLLATSTFMFAMSVHLLVPMMPGYLDSFRTPEAEIGFIVGLLAMTAVFTRIRQNRCVSRREADMEDGRKGLQSGALI